MGIDTGQNQRGFALQAVQGRLQCLQLRQPGLPLRIGFGHGVRFDWSAAIAQAGAQVENLVDQTLFLLPAGIQPR